MTNNFFYNPCEHATRSVQPMFRHLFNCDRFKEVVSFFSVPDSTNYSIDVNFNDHIYQAVHSNCKIIDCNDNWGGGGGGRKTINTKLTLPLDTVLAMRKITIIP